MKFSRFVRIVPSENGAIVLNTMNSCIVEFSADYISNGTIRAGKLSKEEISFLKDNNFFLDDESAIQQFKARTPQNQLDVILSLTEYCNLHCKYCYENNLKTKCVMEKDVIDKVIQYINIVISKEPQINKIHFDLIGGEPLLAIDTIKYLIHEMSYFHELGVSYLLETNGTLFDEKVRDIFSNVNATIHITLSQKDDHDIMRPFDTGDSSYDMIVDNLKESKNFFMNPMHTLSLRYNVHGGNKDNFDNYLSTICATLDFPFILEPAFVINYNYNDWNNSLTLGSYAKWNVDRQLQLLKEPYNDTNFLLKPKNCYPCPGYIPNNIKIHADGSLALCNAWLEVNRRGSIDLLLSGISKEQIFGEVIDLCCLDSECEKCSNLFLCGGKRFCKGDNQCEFVDFDIDDYLKKYVKGRGD